ncbi:hypothetical protein [Flavobacterium chilense]|uniref:Uncharacterized protein n=1 Tax=Flavobacterium chilense TaxID=946677 RepID=A0A1M7ACC4_9FLAO|nr:hypothetical protein [Flavobacterium chilense]SHL40411.1 hypothetical protein SAMN05444484_1011379 [Flavobacterium chilense]
MYVLYYLNRNLQLQTLEVDSLDIPLLIPEDLIFCNLRKGINFIKEPNACIDFTHLERLIISSEFTDMAMLKDNDFRTQNSYLTALCVVDIIPVLLSVDSVSAEGKIYLTDVQQEVLDRIYSCSGDIGLTMHVISSDGIERTYSYFSYMTLVYDMGMYRIDYVEPYHIKQIWFTDNNEHFAKSNVYTYPE